MVQSVYGLKLCTKISFSRIVLLVTEWCELGMFNLSTKTILERFEIKTRRFLRSKDTRSGCKDLWVLINTEQLQYRVRMYIAMHMYYICIYVMAVKQLNIFIW